MILSTPFPCCADVPPRFSVPLEPLRPRDDREEKHKSTDGVGDDQLIKRSGQTTLNAFPMLPCCSSSSARVPPALERFLRETIKKKSTRARTVWATIDLTQQLGYHTLDAFPMLHCCRVSSIRFPPLLDRFVRETTEKRQNAV